MVLKLKQDISLVTAAVSCSVGKRNDNSFGKDSCASIWYLISVQLQVPRISLKLDEATN